MKKILLFIFIFTFQSVVNATDSTTVSNSQGLWDFQKCLDYAMDQNIDMQKSMISIQQSKINTKQAKAQWQPSLSFSTSHSLNNSPWALENQENTSYNGNYNLGASWTVFNGFKRKYTIQEQELQEKIELMDNDQIIENLKTTVLTDYIQILYAIENLNSKRNSFEVAEASYNRNKQLLDAGAISKSDFAQIEAQYFNEKYMLMVAENDLVEARLNLKLLLRTDSDIVIGTPEISQEEILKDIPSKETAYENALNFRPDIQNAELNEQMSDLKIKVAKSSYYPTVNLSASVGSGHNSSAETNFGEQMKQNFGENVGLSLNYSILDNRNRKSEKEKAKLEKQTAILQTEQVKDDLKKLIESACNDATAAQLNYIASLSNEKSAQSSFELTKEKYDLGSKNPYEMLDAKNALLNAQQQTLQAKYTALLNILVLNIYQGLPIDL